MKINFSETTDRKTSKVDRYPVSFFARYGILNTDCHVRGIGAPEKTEIGVEFVMKEVKQPKLPLAYFYLIVLLLEFFISSSTAKAIFVMGILAVANIGLSKSMSVLIYTFADGYTNILFPTSPVLLIALSMIETDYLKWVRKSLPLFILNFLLVLFFIFFGIVIGY